ncbi:sensor histidine kinase [Kitasatospora phosalacinea]|uniref:sensor histidine kinase n=1 Tax=Kitasatospora phosalacinea TaxID=2065 RepID=UPI0035DE3930
MTPGPPPGSRPGSRRGSGPRRPITVRARLTALYAGLFTLTAGAALVTVNLLLEHALRRAAGASIVQADPADPAVLAAPAPPPVPLPVPDGRLGSRILSHQWTATWIAVAVLGVVGAASGWWLAGRVLRPVHRITATARRLSYADLHERIALTGPHDELRLLADTFDAMLDRLERAADLQRRFAAVASHELRTPLAVQRAAIEIGLEDPTPEELATTRAQLLDANLRTERLVDSLLALAQGERGGDHDEPVRLDRIAAEVCAQHRPLAEETGIRLHLDLTPAPTVGDPVLLARLVGNLVHNALRHNHPGGHARITTTPRQLTVTNTGPVVPADRVPRLFEPFQRGPAPHRPHPQGVGLGLAIATAIAESHRTTLRAHPNPGGGLTLVLPLPPD